MERMEQKEQACMVKNWDCPWEVRKCESQEVEKEE